MRIPGDAAGGSGVQLWTPSELSVNDPYNLGMVIIIISALELQ